MKQFYCDLCKTYLPRSLFFAIKVIFQDFCCITINFQTFSLGTMKQIETDVYFKSLLCF